MPETVEQWSLTKQREKLIKTGAKVVSHSRSSAASGFRIQAALYPT